MFVHPPSFSIFFFFKPLILYSHFPSLYLSPPPPLLLLRQQALPCHLLPYFFTFNRYRYRPFQLIQSIYVVANNQHQALPPPAIDQTSRELL
jgi:hypothetical protein